MPRKMSKGSILEAAKQRRLRAASEALMEGKQTSQDGRIQTLPERHCHERCFICPHHGSSRDISTRARGSSLASASIHSHRSLLVW